MSDTVQVENIDKEKMLRQVNKEDAEIKAELAQIVIPEVVIPKVVMFAVKNAGDILPVFQAINTLVDEATFEISPEGITFRGMDPSHVALIDIDLPNSCFDAYEVDTTIKFGVRIDELVKTLKNFDQKEYTRFTVEDSILKLWQPNESASLRLIETTGGSSPLPKLNFNVQIDLNNEGLKRLEKFLTQKEYVTISTNEQAVKLSSKDDSGEIESKFDTSNYLTELRVKDSSLTTYSNDYLGKYLKAVKPLYTPIKSKSKYHYVPEKTVRVEYSSKMPMRIQIRINNIGKLDFYLAPRVQD